ncbi:cytochrome c oxidase accessory protein CcoG [Colwellia sp. TT2012]|uniref:cytochrome c oxidase accessory protein CcoG n=1 Tax=Colwellia sp. TT2012 TaxID=1720342 RepID=UPI000ABBF722|nr:cytochrome c oxidase accessory protein CcoG [Colwellia sp. TT2012]
MRENDPSSSTPKTNKAVVGQYIPIKNVKIHGSKNTGKERYKPGDQIYVRKVSGFFQKLRQRMNLVYFAFFLMLPWLQFNGHQAVLFDISEQRFTLWSLTLWPQDLTLLAWICILGAFLLFFVTTFLGRVWCGYMCPQTVWTFIFIWFEEKIEGTANQRRKLDQQKLNRKKVIRKTLKHSAWLLFSLYTAMTFAGYFSPMQDLFIDVFTLNTSVMMAGILVFFTLATYGNAGWMRETVCLHMCPYARFQSAMFDKDTITVAYDSKRGESRGARGRKQDHKAMGLGDCIDCNLCVDVCPTGIDIRNGLQYECINCGACADACDGVMDKMNYEPGLIRYTTEHELQGKKVTIVRSKLIGYAVLLVIMSTLLVLEIVNRVPLSLEIIRDRTELAKENFNGDIENVFTLKILNMSQTDNTYKLSMQGIANTQWHGKQEVTVKAATVYTLPISISVDPYELEHYMTTITFTVEQVAPIGEAKIEQESRFFNKY